MKKHVVDPTIETLTASGLLGCFIIDYGTERMCADQGILEVFPIKAGKAGQFLPQAEWDRCVHPDDVDWLKDVRVRAAVNTGLRILTFRIVDRHGKVRWLETRARVLTDRLGAPLRATGAAFDITAFIEDGNYVQSNPNASLPSPTNQLCDGLLLAYRAARDLHPQTDDLVRMQALIRQMLMTSASRIAQEIRPSSQVVKH